MNKNSFGSIFLGGRKEDGMLPDKVFDWIESFMENGEHFLVGDCIGADLIFQNYLNARRYTRVTVFHSGDNPQFNLGKWQEMHINVKDEGYDEKPKDDTMIESCDSAFLIWDGETEETKDLIAELRHRGLPIFIYRTDLNRIRIFRSKNIKGEVK